MSVVMYMYVCGHVHACVWSCKTVVECNILTCEIVILKIGSVMQL